MTVYAKSTICESTPTRYAKRARALSPKHERGDLALTQAKTRAGCRSILIADVSEFYPSVYTHSIPWALHTKSIAKLNRTAALFGNQIDKLIRDSQDQQTMGIPIGPDTSFIIAEAILAAADEEFAKRFQHRLQGLRWIDEYQLAFTERSQAEDAFALLQQVLLESELRLNPRKTSISDLPAEFEPEWILELRAFRFRNSIRGQANDLVRYFDYVTRYLEAHPNEHIAKYAIARLRTFAVLPQNQELFESLLCQAAAFEPAAIREVLQALYYAQANRGIVINPALLESTLNTILEQTAPLGQDYEVSWCLWAALSWSIRLSAKAAAAVSLLDNSVVAILALDSQQQGLVPTGLQTSKWQAHMTKDGLYDEQWLLAYEANVKGWLPSVGGVDHVGADPGFGFLKSWGVEFYTKTSNPFVPGGLVYPP